MDENTLNIETRKFLKEVGVTSQREIEKAVRESGVADRVGKFPFSASGKAVAANHPEGFVQVIVDSQYGGLRGRADARYFGGVWRRGCGKGVGHRGGRLGCTHKADRARRPEECV